MSTATRLLTAQEFAALPDEPGLTMELVRGEVQTMPRAKPRHGDIAAEIGTRLRVFVKAGRLGKTFAAETGFLTMRNPDTVRGPDAAFVSARLAEVDDPDDYYPVVPDLVVEVSSPDDRPGRIKEKIEDWLGAGVRLLWQVYPRNRTVAVHRPGAEAVTLGADDVLDGGDVLPGFRCRVGDIFE